MAGTDGNFGKDNETPITTKSVWVRPNVQVDLTTKAPKVIANKGKVHTGWKPSLIGTFTKSDTATEITAQYKTDADNNGVADETETTATPTVTARNIGENPTKTTVEGTAPKGSTVTIKYTTAGGQETTKAVTANEQGKYSADITPKLEAGKEVTVTAKDGEKKVSPEVKTQVFDDKDNDGKDDKSQNFDIAKADKVEMVYDPAKMNYLVTKEDGTVKLETKGMVVKVTDKAGVEKKFTAEEIAKDTKNFKVEPANGAEIGLENNEKPIKVTLNVKGASVTEAKTSNLSVKLDKDGNGVADDQEQFDIKKATKVEILQNPDKMKYSVTKKTDKTPFDAKGVIIRLTDASGKTATYNYDDVIKEENKGKFTLSPADKEQIGLKEDGSVNTIPFTVTVTGADTKPSVTAEENITVILDKDGNGVDDRTEQTSEPDVLARNIGKNPDKTTVEVETEKNAKVTIEYTGKDGQPQKIENLTAGEDGKLTQEIKPMLEKGTEVKVTVQDGEKKPTEKTVKVFDDLDGDKIPDTKAGQTERPAALASNIGKKPTFTTITGEAEKGATVTAYVGTQVVGTATADKTTGKYTIEAKQNNGPIKQGVKIGVTATLAPKAESLKQTVVVFNDTDETGQPDSAKKFDPKKATGMQVVASPDKMVYSDGDKLNLDGLKVLVTDVNGNQKIFTYKHTDNSDFKNSGLSVDLKQETVLSSKDYDAQTAKDGHNGRKLVVTLDTTGNTSAEKAITGQTPTALTVNKNQSAQPTDVVVANQGDATVTKVKGKATKDAEIKITDGSGQSLLPKGTTINADANGDFTADLNKLLDPGAKVFVTATEPGKSESPKAETTVIRDKDGNWKPDTGSKLSTPVIDPIRENDEKVVVAAPKAGDKIQTIEVSDQSGNKVTLTKDPADTTGKTWKVDGSNPEVKVKEENGKIAIPVKGTLPLNDRDQIKVTFKDGENPANEAFDKAPVQKASQTPKVDPVYTGDKNVKIADPTVADPTAKTIKVKVGDKDSMTVEKQPDGSWKVKEDPNEEVKVEDGKIVVPLDPSAKKGDVIKVSTINDSGKASPEAKVTVEDKAATKKPTINRANKDENSVSGTAAPNAEVTVTVTPKSGEPKTFTGKADGDGNYKVTTDPLVDGDTVVVKASEPGKADNTSDPKVVGVDTSKLKDSIDKAEEIGGKDGANLNPGTNKVDKELKDALDKAKEVKAKGDAGDPNTDQKAVDKAKDDLDKAIAQKEADTAVDKAKDNPTPENIKDAQDKIDAIPGSKDPKAKDYNPIKKDLQDKLDLIKIIKEAEKETQKEGYKDKPTQDKTALEKAIADGKENLKNNTKITESTNTIQEKLDTIRMERIKVGVESLAVGIKTLKIKTSVPGATVKIKIDGVLIDTIKTDAYGTFSKGLEAEIQENQEIVLEASKPGYNDGSFNDTVY
nr:Ig-like domain-containing protein [Peptostreptococcus anaerobius]